MHRQRPAQIIEEGLKAERVGDGEVFRLHQFRGELAHHIDRLVGQTRTGNDCQGIGAVVGNNLVQPLGRETNRFIPGGRHQAAAFLISN